MLADTNSGLYKTLFVLHVLVAIVGLGAVMLNGLYAAQSRQRPGPPGRAIAEANYAVSQVGSYFIYAIAVSGVLLVLASDGVWKFSQTWVWLSLAVFAVAIGIAHGMIRPGAERIIAAQREMEQGPPPTGGPPPQVAEIQATGRRLALGGALNNGLVVVLLILMVWKPGV